MAATSRRPHLVHPLVATALGAAMVALGGISAAAITGRRIRNRHDASLDALSSRPDSVVHHRIPTADGGSIHVVETGQGRPIMLLHGVTLQWWVWSPLITLLADRYRVIAWDMSGHGESELGSDGLTIDTMARDLATVLDTLDCTDAVLVGHSLGGCLIGNFIGLQPQVLRERVAGLVFVATAANLSSNLFRHGSLKTMFGAAGGLLLMGLRKPNPNMTWTDNDLSAALLGQAFGPSATAEMIDVVRTMTSEFSAQTSTLASRVLTSHDARENLATVSIPTTIVGGEYDKILPPDHSVEIAELVPHSRLVELAGTGHQIMQEAPQELAAEIDLLVERIDAAAHAGPNGGDLSS